LDNPVRRTVGIRVLNGDVGFFAGLTDLADAVGLASPDLMKLNLGFGVQMVFAGVRIIETSRVEERAAPKFNIAPALLSSIFRPVVFMC
jgi:hypothetical protein